MHMAVAAAPAGAPSTSGRQAEWRPARHPPTRQCRLMARPAAGEAGCWAAAVAAGRQQCRRQQRAVAAAVADTGELAPQASGSEDEEWVEVGRIGPPHGVRGEMKVQPLTDFPEDRLGTPGPRWVQAPAPKIGRRQAAPAEEVELEWGRSMISKGNEVWLVKLEGVESPEEAALLRGHSLLIPASARPALEDEDEFYIQDLVGLQVVLQATGEEVGHVSDVFDGTGTHDVLRIQLSASLLERLSAANPGSSQEEEEEEEEEGAAAASNGGSATAARHVLLPFAKAMVPVVDLAAGRMEVTPPEGLLELAAPSNQRKPRRENRGKRDRRRPRPRGQQQAAAEAGASGASSSSDAA